MSRNLDFMPDGLFPVTLVFSKANPGAGADNVLTLPQGNGFVVPPDYNFHPLGLSVKTNAALTELIANGGFETAGEGDPDFFASWTETAGNGAIAVEAGAGNFHGGAKSCKLTTGADGAVSMAEDITVIPGYVYSLTFWVKGDGVVNKSQYSIVDKTNTADIVAAKDVPTASAAYYQVTESFTAPEDCVTVTINLLGCATEGSIVYLDDVSVTTVECLEPTAVYNLLADGVVVAQPQTWTDDITRKNYDDAHVDGPSIGSGAEITVGMTTTANYVPVTGDVDAVVLGVLKHN